MAGLAVRHQHSSMAGTLQRLNEFCSPTSKFWVRFCMPFILFSVGLVQVLKVSVLQYCRAYGLGGILAVSLPSGIKKGILRVVLLNFGIVSHQ